jgi:hypothetical protein
LEEILVVNGIQTGQLPPLLFAFDEASNLLSILKNSHREGFRTLRYALNFLPPANERKLRYFSLVCDTMGRLANFIPLNVPDPSLRYVQSVSLFEPIIDIRCWNRVRAPTELQTSIGDLSKVALDIGRPLWRSLANTVANSDLSGVVDVAMFKLTNTVSMDGLRQKPSLTQALAVLTARFGVRVSATSTISRDLSHSHLSMCIGVDRDNDVFYSKYVTETVVGLAAQRLMTQFPQYSYENLLPILVDSLNIGMIHTGVVGELVHAVILTEAYDRAMKASDDALRGVTLESLFRSLLTDSCFAQLESDISRSGKSEQWKQLSQARIRLTQMAKLAKLPTISEDIVQYYNVGLYGAFINGHPGNDFVTGLSMNGKPSVFMASVKNVVKGLSDYKAEAAWRSSLFGSCMQRNTSTPDGSPFVCEQADDPYLVLFHNVCSQNMMQTKNQNIENAVSVWLPQAKMRDAAKDAVKAYRRKGKKSGNIVSYATEIDGRCYAVQPSDNQLMIKVDGFTYGNHKSPVYRASPTLVDLFQQLSRSKPMAFLPDQALGNSDPYVNKEN